MLWINFLHFYQPASADNETVAEATEKSYNRIIRALVKNKKIRFTANITGCLLERWDKLGYCSLIADIRRLVRAGRLELVGSSAHHHFLPLLPDAEVKRQIKLQAVILKKFFGPKLSPRGFFIPEAAYDRRIAKLIRGAGYRWIILDEISAHGKINGLDYSTKYIDRNSGLKICFRSRSISRSYVPRAIAGLLSSGREEAAVTASDAELYGLRHTDIRRSFERVLSEPGLRTLTVSEYLGSLKKTVAIRPVASSWESTEADLSNGLPYHLWHDPKNMIQAKLWELAQLAIRTVKRYPKDPDYGWARGHLDKGLSSCAFWWASAQDFRLFGPISWSPDEIERGASELIRSIRALDDLTTRATKIRAEKLYIAVKTMIWQKHWRYYWKR